MWHKKNNSSVFPCVSSPISLFPAFVLRLLESSLLNAEVKEGEILPPTIQRLMKGYNKYLRPFFDSKENCSCIQPEEREKKKNLLTVSSSYCNLCAFACMCLPRPLLLIHADMSTFQFIVCVRAQFLSKMRFIALKLQQSKPNKKLTRAHLSAKSSANKLCI